MPAPPSGFLQPPARSPSRMTPSRGSGPSSRLGRCYSPSTVERLRSAPSPSTGYERQHCSWRGVNPTSARHDAHLCFIDPSEDPPSRNPSLSFRMTKPSTPLPLLAKSSKRDRWLPSASPPLHSSKNSPFRSRLQEARGSMNAPSSPGMSTSRLALIPFLKERHSSLCRVPPRLDDRDRPIEVNESFDSSGSFSRGKPRKNSPSASLSSSSRRSGT